MTEADKPFIHSSWSNSYRTSPANKGMPSKVYKRVQSKLINRTLARSLTVIACSPDAADQIFGWMCFETAGDAIVLHYVYVKYRFRKFGLARRMIELLHRHTTHDTPFFASHAPASDYLEHLQNHIRITYDPSTKG